LHYEGDETRCESQQEKRNTEPPAKRLDHAYM
jgi:hypothetical protein